MKMRFSHRFWLVAILSIISIWGALGERTPFNSGLGWDGKNYAFLTADFERMALAKEIDSYQYKRILTPLVIFYAAKLFHIELSIDTIPYVFRVFNLLLIGCVVWLFFKLCSHFNFKPYTEIIGFTALFFNYFILKNTPYYPVLTDISGFWIGMIICYLFLKQQKVALFFSVLLSHFTFPLLLLTSIPLIANIRNNNLLISLQSTSLFRVITVLSLLTMLSLIALILFQPTLLDPKYTMTIHQYALPLSILWVLFYQWKLLMSFQQPGFMEGTIEWKKSLVLTIGIVGFILLVNYGIAQISIPENRFTPQVFLFNIIQQSISYPFVSIVAHSIYFGPAIMLMLLYFKPIIQSIKQQGDSAVVYFIVITLFCLGSESRQFVPYYPFLVVMLMLAINSFSFTRRQVILFVILSILFSKCWFPINVPGIFESYDFGNFPDQRYFMNHGPFMSKLSYLINLGIALIMGGCIYLVFRKTELSNTNFTESSIPSL